jgi:hypothetical protein
MDLSLLPRRQAWSRCLNVLYPVIISCADRRAPDVETSFGAVRLCRVVETVPRNDVVTRAAILASVAGIDQVDELSSLARLIRSVYLGRKAADLQKMETRREAFSALTNAEL